MACKILDPNSLCERDALIDDMLRQARRAGHVPRRLQMLDMRRQNVARVRKLKSLRGYVTDIYRVYAEHFA